MAAWMVLLVLDLKKKKKKKKPSYQAGPWYPGPTVDLGIRVQGLMLGWLLAGTEVLRLPNLTLILKLSVKSPSLSPPYPLCFHPLSPLSVVSAKF
jgi:hypothetical protein